MVLYHGGEVLFEVRTAPPCLAGKLAFPGGKWESPDEDLARTAMREIEEELNVCVPALRETLCAYASDGHHVSTYIASRPLGSVERRSLAHVGMDEQRLVWKTSAQLSDFDADSFSPSAHDMIAQLCSVHAWIFDA